MSLKPAYPGAEGWAVSLIADIRSTIAGLFKMPVPIPAYTKASLPNPAAYYSTAITSGGGTSALIFVTDDVGGSVPAFTDGTNWRRVTDRNVVS